MEAADAALAMALLSGFSFFCAAAATTTADVALDSMMETDVAATVLSGFCSCSAAAATATAMAEAADAAASQFCNSSIKGYQVQESMCFIPT